MYFVFIKLSMLIFLQIWQRQIFKQQVKIFIFRDIEDKFIRALTILAGVTLTTATASAATLRALDAIVLHKMVVARVNTMALAATALMETRFINVINGN